MTLYIGREASKLWKRICAEASTEIHLLGENWKYLLAGLIMQYVHGLAARGVHYLHRPGPMLQDTGFTFLPELGQDKGHISEAVFSFIFLSFILWTFHPFVFKSKKIYTVLIWCRVLAFLVASQFLRIITFYSTQLPGPNYHCREGSKLARLPRPDSVVEVLLINFPRGVIYGCGDLIFSSHMIFTLVFVLTYQKYGMRRFIKQIAWLLAITQSLLIIASRKHYTVDIVVAWYTVNLVVFYIDKKLPELPDRATGVGTFLLPLSTRDKDGRTKEENHKLLSGNSGDPADWVCTISKFSPCVYKSSLISVLFIWLSLEAENSSEWQGSGRWQLVPCGYSNEWCVDDGVLHYLNDGTTCQGLHWINVGSLHLQDGVMLVWSSPFSRLVTQHVF